MVLKDIAAATIKDAVSPPRPNHGSVTLKIALSKAQYRAFHAWLTTMRGAMQGQGPIGVVLARVLDQVPVPDGESR